MGMGSKKNKINTSQMDDITRQAVYEQGFVDCYNMCQSDLDEVISGHADFPKAPEVYIAFRRWKKRHVYEKMFPKPVIQ